MVSLIKGLKLLAIQRNQNPSFLISFLRHAHWNKDFKPAKYPVTEEERDAAAKKYYLWPEEYKPYTDDGQGYGDYPKLSDISVETRDPYYPYDFPEHKRNLHEPVHAEIDMFGEDRYGTGEPLRYEMRTYWLAFLGVLGGCFGLYYFLEDKKMFRPVLPKQLPDGNKQHYTFETNK